MRWVVTTALGSLVEPEVKRNLAMLSGPVAANAASASASPGCCNRLAKSRCGLPATAPRTTISGVSPGSTASIARWKAAPSLTNTSPGCIRSQTCRNLAKSWDNSE